MTISVVYLEAGAQATFTGSPNHQQYLIQIEGAGEVNGSALDTKDAAEIFDEDITITAHTQAHYILFDMQKV